jgi:hypothetical protein
MSRPVLILALLCWAGCLFGVEKVFDFREFKLNEAPAGFISTVTGEGKPGDWRIIQDEVPSLLPPFSPNAPKPKQQVLAQLAGDRTDEHFPLLIYAGESYGDFTLTTRFKLVDGLTEQMAGIAFRIQDERNYYYIRASALGGTYYFFKIVNGVRSAPIGVKVEIPKGVWHEMTIECRGPRIRSLLNGKETIPWLDDKSFGSGKIGFWTKSDSVSYFVDARLDYRPREILAQVLVKDAVKKYPRLLGLKIFASTNNSPMRTIASMDLREVGQLAPSEVRQVLTQKGFFYHKARESVSVTLPLRDSNGDKVAAIQVIMKTFLGQTENNALARATPVVKEMETRITSLAELLQ